MNGLGTIACATGLQDGLNPCIFMACAVLILQRLWLKRNSLEVFWPQVIFISAYASGFLVFNFGPAQVLLFGKNFVFAAKAIYFVLGTGSFVLGILFLKDWFLLRATAGSGERLVGVPPGTVNVPVVLLVTAALGVVLSALATLWPINNYIMLLGNESLLKGQWQPVMVLLIGYVLSSMWALWFVWALMSLKDLRPSFLKIFDAAVFFTASSCMIFIFK